jgi:hypothetical protein
MKMTAVANLLARKQKILEQLRNGPPAQERDEIERQLKQIDAALDLLEGLGEAGRHRTGEPTQ